MYVTHEFVLIGRNKIQYIYKEIAGGNEGKRKDDSYAAR